MRESVRYTLLGDGSSDRALVPVLDWLFREHLPNHAVLEQGQVAELGRLRDPPPLGDLKERIRTAIEFYPCDVLFVHRDAEQRDGYSARRSEAERAAEDAGVRIPCIPVVPVRMTEAWLLIDEAALRRAAGRPEATSPLTWPRPASIEQIHAKEVLFGLLQAAAGQTGRRRRRISPETRRARLARLIEDYAPLRRFESFQDLERDVRAFCST